MAGCFDDVHGLIGEANGVTDRFFYPCDVETDASAHHHFIAVYQVRLGQDSFQPNGELRQPLGGDALGADAELIASETSDTVVWTQLGAHSFSGVEEDFISGVMAGGVVDRLEVVKVDVQNAHVFLRPSAPVRIEGPVQLLGKQNAIA